MVGVMLDTLAPKRAATFRPNKVKSLVVASDGRLDDSMPPSAAVLIFDPITGYKLSRYCIASRQLVEQLGNDLTIAVVETFPIILAFLQFPKLFRGRDVNWFEESRAVGLQRILECYP